MCQKNTPNTPPKLHIYIKKRLPEAGFEKPSGLIFNLISGWSNGFSGKTEHTKRGRGDQQLWSPPS